LTVFFLGLQVLTAQVIIDQGHTDINFDFTDQQWVVKVRDLDQVLYDPSDVILYAFDEASPNGSRITRPSGTQWDFLGVDAGESLYFFPQSENANILFPGFSADGTIGGPSSPLAAYSESDSRVSSTPARWITIHLREVTYFGEGDGHFSMWRATGTETTVWMSTAQGGITSTDKFLMQAGGHNHMNWGFSDVGVYDITFEATAFLNDGNMTPTSSGLHTFRFGIAAIPEPSSLALLLLAGAAMALRTRLR